MKKCIMSALLALFLLCSGTTVLYAGESQTEQEKEVTLEVKKVTAEAGCTAADLQALLDTNKEGKYELTVNIPAGTYALTQTLYVYPNTTIAADVDAVFQQQSLYGSMLEAYLPKDSKDYKGNHDITIEGGIWESTPTMKEQKGTKLFVFSNCSDISMADVTLRNVPGQSQLLVLTDVKNVTISNCKFYGYENWKSAKKSAAIQIASKDVACDDITIMGCELYELSQAIYCEAGNAKYHTNIKLDSNRIYDISDSALYLVNNQKSRVSNNTITNASGYGIYIKNSPEIRVLNNEIKNAGKIGIYLYQSGGKDANNCTKIGDNTIIGAQKGTGTHGIKISNSKYTAVYSNTLEDIGGTGIYVLKSKNCKVGLGTNTNNTIENTTEHGIYVKDCDGIKAQYNKISGAKKQGIAIYSSSKPTVNRNTVSAKKNGILVKGSCTSAKVTNNTIKEAGENGISVVGKGSGIKVNGNTIKKYAVSLKDGKGIYVSQAGGKSSKKCSTISKNKITGTGKSTKKYGIYVRSSSYTTIESNTLNYIAGTAIYVSKSKNCNVNKNTIKQAKKIGIYLDKGCDKAKIRTNTLNKVAGTSILVNDAPKALIYANTVSSLKNKKGIYVKASDEATIKTNTIKGTKESLAIKISRSEDCEEKNNTID